MLSKNYSPQNWRIGIKPENDPSSLWRAMPDRSVFALASYAGQVRLRSGELCRTGPSSLWRRTLYGQSSYSTE
jgi:hypothetical protein